MRWMLIVLLSVGCAAQVTVSGVKITNVTITPGALPITFAMLPQVWADTHECPSSTGTYDVVKTIPGSYTAANAQQANVDWAAAADQSWHVIVTHGTVIAPLTMLAKAVGGGMPTKCIVWDSDTPLPAGRTVCTHGIQDNIATSTDPGVRNPDCNGSGMSYQIQQTLTPISPGAFTLANGTATNTSAYNDVASMYTIECNTVNCASVQEGSVDVNGNGANHFAIYNAEIRVNVAQTCCWPVDLENAGSTVQSNVSHYHFDRVWLHSDATDAGKGVQGLTDYIRLNCGGNCTISNSAGSKGLRPGAEGHGIYFSDAGQFKVVHNWIEGMSIGLMNGGISTSVPGGVTGRDAEIRRNRFTYPLPWLGHGSGAGSVCGVNISCVRKNCMEEKGALRYIVDGNICENVDNSGGQNGVITDWNNRACTPNVCDNYAQTIQHITLSNNIYRHGCGGILFDANSGNPGSSGNSASTPGRNFFVQNDLLYDISTANFGCGITTQGTVLFGVANHDFTVTSVTRNPAGTVSTIVLAGGTGENFTGLVAGDPIILTGCTNGSFNAGPYPFVPALTVSGTTITYSNPGPGAVSTTCTGFNNGAGWPNFMTVDHVTAIADPDIYMGSNGSVPDSTFARNVTYQNSIFSGTRGLGQGGGSEGTVFENQFIDTATLLIHHDIFSQRVAPVWTATTAYKLGQTVQPSGTPSHFYTAVKSGTSAGSQPVFPSTSYGCVTDGTVTWQENGFRMVQTGGLPSYTEYRALATPISPPTTLFFPRTDFTYGATADATSIGFTGALNAPASGTNACVSGTQVTGINAALDLADWHGYALDSTSAYKTSGVGGSALGVSISAIDAAQTSTQYVCTTACGTGPTPD
jgi:hypothetical protein